MYSRLFARHVDTVLKIFDLSLRGLKSEGKDNTEKRQGQW
jgi:hypothetical protein